MYNILFVRYCLQSPAGYSSSGSQFDGSCWDAWRLRSSSPLQGSAPPPRTTPADWTAPPYRATTVTGPAQFITWPGQPHQIYCSAFLQYAAGTLYILLLTVFCTVLYHIMYCTSVNCTLLYCTVPYLIILYFTLLYCTSVNCTLL